MALLLKRLLLRFLLLSSLGIVLAACGGKDSATGASDIDSDTADTTQPGTTEQEPPGDEPDTTAPQVSKTTPVDDSTGVARSSRITAEFSEDILATSVDSQSAILLENGSEIAATVSFDAANNSIDVAPMGLLKLLHRYQVTLDNSISDLSGNSLGADYSWSFTVRDGIWREPGLIENDDTGDAFYPELAFDNAGNALAVWQQTDGTRFNIWAARYEAGDGWLSPVLIETDNAGDAYGPQIAVDGDGNAIAVWHQSDGSRSNIWANRYTPEAGWGMAERIEIDDAGDAEEARVAFDVSGNALAVWYQSDGTRDNIRANRYTAGSGWGTAVTIETENLGNAHYPEISIDANGDALVVWEQHDGTRKNIWANRYTTTGGWSTAEKIEMAAGYAQYPQIAFDADGNALAVWQQYGTTWINIRANRYTPASGWGAASDIENQDGGDAKRPKLAFDDAGKALVVWQQSDGMRTNIWSNQYLQDDGWLTAVRVQTDGAGEAKFPEIAFDSSGNAIAVWQYYDGAMGGGIQANRYRNMPAGGWGDVKLLESGLHGFPEVAVSRDGNALALWNHFDSSGRTDISGASFD